MIRKLRLKFVAICMALVTAILAVVFFSVYLSMARNISDLSRQVLYRVSQEETIGGMTRPDISIAIGGDRVLLPYFTVNVWPSRGGGYTAQITGGTYSNLEDTEELTAILQDCLSQNRQEGTVSG